MDKLRVKLLTDDATMPTRSHPHDAGLDLYAAESEIIYQDHTAVIKTDIAVEIPAGYQAEIRPRSGKTSKTSLRVQLGTIDAGYIGPLGVICDCHPKDLFCQVTKGDKIAQLVITPVETPTIELVDNFSETDRGAQGYGSTGE